MEPPVCLASAVCDFLIGCFSHFHAFHAWAARDKQLQALSGERGDDLIGKRKIALKQTVGLFDSCLWRLYILCHRIWMFALIKSHTPHLLLIFCFSLKTPPQCSTLSWLLHRRVVMCLSDALASWVPFLVSCSWHCSVCSCRTAGRSCAWRQSLLGWEMAPWTWGGQEVRRRMESHCVLVDEEAETQQGLAGMGDGSVPRAVQLRREKTFPGPGGVVWPKCVPAVPREELWLLRSGWCCRWFWSCPCQGHPSKSSKGGFADRLWM